MKIQMNLGMVLRKLIFLIAQCSPSNSTKRSSFQRSSSIAVLFNSRPEKRSRKKWTLCNQAAVALILHIDEFCPFFFGLLPCGFFRFPYAKFWSRIQLSNGLFKVNLQFRISVVTWKMKYQFVLETGNWKPGFWNLPSFLVAEQKSNN